MPSNTLKSAWWEIVRHDDMDSLWRDGPEWVISAVKPLEDRPIVEGVLVFSVSSASSESCLDGGASASVSRHDVNVARSSGGLAHDVNNAVYAASVIRSLLLMTSFFK